MASHWDTATFDNFMMEWNAKYYTVLAAKKDLLANDFSTVRVFILNEIQLFLYIHNFEIIKTRDHQTYVYDTQVIVAKKELLKVRNVSNIFILTNTGN
jgi:hypothetical protein